MNSRKAVSNRRSCASNGHPTSPRGTGCCPYVDETAMDKEALNLYLGPFASHCLSAKSTLDIAQSISADSQTLAQVEVVRRLMRHAGEPVMRRLPESLNANSAPTAHPPAAWWGTATFFSTYRSVVASSDFQPVEQLFIDVILARFFEAYGLSQHTGTIDFMLCILDQMTALYQRQPLVIAIYREWPDFVSRHDTSCKPVNGREPLSGTAIECLDSMNPSGQTWTVVDSTEEYWIGEAPIKMNLPNEMFAYYKEGVRDRAQVVKVQPWWSQYGERDPIILAETIYLLANLDEEFDRGKLRQTPFREPARVDDPRHGVNAEMPPMITIFGTDNRGSVSYISLLVSPTEGRLFSVRTCRDVTSWSAVFATAPLVRDLCLTVTQDVE